MAGEVPLTKQNGSQARMKLIVYISTTHNELRPWKSGLNQEVMFRKGRMAKVSVKHPSTVQESININTTGSVILFKSKQNEVSMCTVTDTLILQRH